MPHTAASGPVDLAFVFIGGLHQALHIAPVALALARRDGVRVTGYVAPTYARELAGWLERIDADAAPLIRLVPMMLPRWARVVQRLLGPNRGVKPVRLVAWRRRLLRHDALVVAERTSTLLKRWPGRRPIMIHIPHGSGDRAKGTEPRLALFDHLLVGGEGKRARILASLPVAPERVDAIGSTKLAGLTGPRAAPAPRLFADDRPVVLYNPHFDTALSSWAMAWPIAQAIAADSRFNLVVAPHIRLGRALPADERARWTAFGERPGVIVDLGSERLSDMTYTRAADIYLGDVSSQVYEFLARPRPAVFVNAHGVAWRDHPDYGFWRLGDVADDPAGVVAALAAAGDRHAEYAARQVEQTALILGPHDPGVPSRAADALLAGYARIRQEAA